MSFKMVWRSVVFLITLAFIYLAFPILIVPSSLPAIKAIVVEGVKPTPTPTPTPDYGDFNQAVPIQQIEIPQSLNLTQKVEELKKLHDQGMELILNR